MRILLSNLPWEVKGRQGVRAGSRWPHLKIDEEEDYMPFPFFLAHSTTLLKKEKMEVLAIDAIAENMSYNKFLEKVTKFKPDLFFAEVSTPSLENDINILKEISSKINGKIAIAGPDMNVLDKDFMKKNVFVGFVLFGEYELTLLDLVKRLKEKKLIKKIEGLYANINGKIYENKRRELEKDLTNYGWPDREFFPIRNYHDCPGSIPYPSAQMTATRGCPFLCTFCVWPSQVYGGRNYRFRPAKDIVDEMEYLVKEKGARSIYFDDDTFNIGKKRVIELAREIQKRELNIPWAFMGRADLVDKETLRELKKSGLAAVKYGVESAVQEIVDACEKKLDIEKATKNIILTKKFGIKVHLTFTFGLPGETRDTINKTIKYVLKLDPESVQFSIMTPFPGTKFYDQLKKKNMIVSDDFTDYDGNTQSVIRTKDLSPEDIKRAQEKAYSVWREHKVKNKRYKENNAVDLFINCLNEHGLKYTLRHTYQYIINRNHS